MGGLGEIQLKAGRGFCRILTTLTAMKGFRRILVGVKESDLCFTEIALRAELRGKARGDATAREQGGPAAESREGMLVARAKAAGCREREWWASAEKADHWARLGQGARRHKDASGGKSQGKPRSCSGLWAEATLLMGVGNEKGKQMWHGNGLQGPTEPSSGDVQ